MQKKLRDMASSIEKIEALAEKYNLSYTVKEAIIQISKDAYIQGHNDCYKQLKEFGKLKE